MLVLSCVWGCLYFHNFELFSEQICKMAYMVNKCQENGRMQHHCQGQAPLCSTMVTLVPLSAASVSHDSALQAGHILWRERAQDGRCFYASFLSFPGQIGGYTRGTRVSRPKIRAHCTVMSRTTGQQNSSPHALVILVCPTGTSTSNLHR